MDTRALAAVLVDNLVTQPVVVHALVDYWLRHYVPVDTLVAAHVPLEPRADAWLTALVRRLLVARPHDLVLRLQTAVLPSVHALTTRPLCVLSFVPPMARPIRCLSG
jgi:hypothetical protein